VAVSNAQAVFGQTNQLSRQNVRSCDRQAPERNPLSCHGGLHQRVRIGKGGACDIAIKLPAAVSQKREYFNYSPETIGDLSLEVAKFGARRPTATLQKPAIGGAFLALLRAKSLCVGLVGWRGSADRTGLRTNSLVSGNFTGNFAILGLRDTIEDQETAALQPLPEQFPTRIIRENILRIREFFNGIRELHFIGDISIFRQHGLAGSNQFDFCFT
jgi:hypothetical protein